jgi:thiol-disulfide isomerase/thioredoxin
VTVTSTRSRQQPLQLSTVDMHGAVVDLAKLRGKVVLVDVWSNWCGACIDAMPKLQKIYDQYRGQGFEILGLWLSNDEAKEKPQAVDHLEAGRDLAQRRGGRRDVYKLHGHLRHRQRTGDLAAGPRRQAGYHRCRGPEAGT